MYKREERLWLGGCGLFPSRFLREKVSWATLPGKLGILFWITKKKRVTDIRQ